jgi:hypothetical protein
MVGCRPGTIFASTWSIPGSIRVTVPSLPSATQTEWKPTATSYRSAPIPTFATSLPVAGSSRVTVPSSAFATQTPPAPTASATGCLPTRT